MMQSYLVCYDICDEKLLRRIAKHMERVAQRIQYSVFLLPDSSKEEIQALAEEICELGLRKRDDVRIYPIKRAGIVLGRGVDLKNSLTL